MKTKSTVYCLYYAVLILMVGAGSGCRYHDNSLIYLQKGVFIKQDWTKLVSENPIGEKENIKVLNLGKTNHASYHLVQIMGKEEPHIHKENDLIVVVKKGKGIIHVGKKSFEVENGSIQMIPKGVEHSFENKCKCGSVAFTVFSPPFEK